MEKIRQLSTRHTDFTVNLDVFKQTFDNLIDQISDLKQLDPQTSYQQQLQPLSKVGKPNAMNESMRSNPGKKDRDLRDREESIYRHINRSRDTRKVDGIKTKLTKSISNSNYPQTRTRLNQSMGANMDVDADVDVDVDHINGRISQLEYHIYDEEAIINNYEEKYFNSN